MSPNVGVNLIPEYAGAVLNGSIWPGNNVGTLTSDICSYSLNINRVAPAKWFVLAQRMTTTTTDGPARRPTVKPTAFLCVASCPPRSDIWLRHFSYGPYYKHGQQCRQRRGQRCEFSMFRANGTQCGATTTVTTATNTWATGSILMNTANACGFYGWKW